MIHSEIYHTNLFFANMIRWKYNEYFNDNITVSYYQVNTEYNGDFNQNIEYGNWK